ncbi:mas-related G-protein coupled receptor member X4-like [Sarcophilus harrisii]
MRLGKVVVHLEALTIINWTDILSLLIAPLGLVGNGAVLWLLGFRIRRNPFSVYILNLAVADTLFLCSPSAVYVRSSPSGTDVAAPSTVVCAVLWALAGMFMITYIFLYREIRFIIHAGYFLLLTCVRCVSSLTLLLKVQCSSRHRRPPRLYLLVLLTVLVFLLCGLPLGIWDIIYFYSKLDRMLYWLCDPLACVNSSVNPLIYFFVGRLGNRRREPLREVLQRALGDEQELERGTTNTPHTSSPETTL